MRREKLEKLKKRTIEILNTEVFSFKEAYWVISTGAKFAYKSTINLSKNIIRGFTSAKIKTSKKKQSTQAKETKHKNFKGFKIESPFKKFTKSEVTWNNLELKDFDFILNKLKKQLINIKKPSKTSVSIKKQECLHPDYIMVRNITDFEQIVTWQDYLPGFSTTARLYDTGLYHQFNLQKHEASVPNPNIKTMNENEVQIKSEINVKSETIKIKPYTKYLNPSELYRFPLQLEPCGIGFFSNSQLDEFKALLANSQKTKPYNVEIINVYDNFNIELYLKIMQSPNTNKFNCFLSPEKQNYNKFRQFYLVVGKRKDNNASITALYPKKQD